ncbi:MAG: hypothetical protein J3R72DRAFT_457633 [Linnemannia gamsii]|nr:MAG: hypothetical protein J3R72DRAFT_457633 [Linnemannia gamsii]
MFGPYSQGVQQNDTTFDADDTLGVLFSGCKQQQTHHCQQQQQHLYQKQYPNQTMPTSPVHSVPCRRRCRRRRLLPPSKLLQENPPLFHLEELSLVFCFGIANAEFQTLFRFFRNKSLRSLNLQFTNIEDSGLEALARNLGHRLTSISVSFCNRITARGIRALVNPHRCPRLLELEFLSCDLVSADCFRTPEPWGCRRLRRLEFTFHPRVAMARMESDRAAAEAEEKKEREQQQQQQEQEQSISEEPMVDGVGPSNSGLVSPHAQEQSQQGQAQQQQQEHLEEQQHNQQQQQQQQLQQITPTHTYKHDKQALPLDSGVHSEESPVREQTRDNLWLEEQESVRNDYYTLFRQLKRLTELRYLNIYNSPALNSIPSGCDVSQINDSLGPSEVTVNVNESDSNLPLVNLTPTTPLQQPWSDSMEEVDESSSGSSNFTSRQEHRRASIASESEQDENQGKDAEGHFSAPHDHQSTVSPGEIEQLDPCQELAEATPTLSVPEPATIHPFSLRMGLKALGRLTQLESLTFYERSSVTLGQAEVRWIGKHFPHLSMLQLRGSIDVPGKATRQLAIRRPDVRIQVCSLFE